MFPSKRYIKFIFVFFFLVVFFLLIKSKASACTGVYPAYTYPDDPNKCKIETCNGAPSNTYSAYIRYYTDISKSFSCDQLEYFPNNTCNISGPRASFSCSGSCSIDADCGEGTCAGGDANVTMVCTNINRGTQPYYCQGYNCGYTCPAPVSYTCRKLSPGEGQGASQSYCQSSCVAPTNTPTPTSPPPPTATPTLTPFSCSVSAVSTSTTSGRGTVSTSGNVSHYDRVNWFLNGQYKGTNNGPTADFTGLSELSSYTVSATYWASDGQASAKSCGSANFSTGGTAPQCVVNVTTCSCTGAQAGNCPTCGGGWCQASVCSSCAPQPPQCTGAMFDTPSFTCAENETISGSVISNYGTDYITYDILNSSNTLLCRTGHATYTGNPGNSKETAWNGKGCGTITSDTSMGLPELDPVKTTFNTSTVNRDYYFVTLYGYINGGTKEIRCKYRASLSGSVVKSTITGTDCESGALNDSTIPFFVNGSQVTASRGAGDNLIFNFQVVKKDKSKPDWFYAKVVMSYPGDTTVDTVETGLCTAYVGGHNCTDYTCTGGCTTGELGQAAWLGSAYWYYYNYSFNGETGLTTFKGTPGTTYTVNVNASNRSGGCSYALPYLVTCPKKYTVTGRIFLDKDHDGTWDATDTAYTGTGITITARDITTGTAVPQANISYVQSTGTYMLINAVSGHNYEITTTIPGAGSADNSPNNYKTTTPNPVLASVTNANITGKNIGITPLHWIDLFVFRDNNNNGVWDSAQGEDALSPAGISYGFSTTDAKNYAYSSGGVGYIKDVRNGTYSVRLLINDSRYKQTNTAYLTNPRTITVSSNTPYTVPRQIFGIVPYSISGNVYLETTGNRRKDGTDTLISGATIWISGNGISRSTVSSSGGYSFTELPGGSYSVYIPGGVGGYSNTFPSGLPPSFNPVIIGNTCSVSPSNNPAEHVCTSGNISNLNFGFGNLPGWLQGKGGDLRDDNRFGDEIPAIGEPYASIPKALGGTAGIVFSGSFDPYFGNGGPSAPGWQAGNLSYPEEFLPKTGIKTSYDYITNTISQAGLSYNTLACTYTNCTLPANLANGLYKINQSLNLGDPNSTTLPRPTYTFPVNKNYVFVVNGNLTINTNIVVPIGGTATFIVNGNIVVKSGVTGLAGIYSADQIFEVQGIASCPTPDTELTIEGTAVANAEQSVSNFRFIYPTRSLCSENQTTPVINLMERPDFLLNLPQLIRVKNKTWQEVVP